MSRDSEVLYRLTSTSFINIQKTAFPLTPSSTCIVPLCFPSTGKLWWPLSSEDVTSFTCVGWVWLWTWSSTQVVHTFGTEAIIDRWNTTLQCSLLTQEFDGPTPAFCRGSPVLWRQCWDSFQNWQGDEAYSSFLFLLMKMIILKAVLVWNNKADGIWGALFVSHVTVQACL